MARIKEGKFQDAYYENEAAANRHMSYVNAAAGILALIIWICYLTKIFEITKEFFPLVAILFPCIAVLMFVPLFLVKTKLIRTEGYKYFIMFSLLAVVMALNIALPKHSLLFWPFVILIANHYYNPTVGRVVFIVTLACMLACMYLCLFFGEFDENLFGGGVVMPDGSIGTVDTFEERKELLADLARHGNNRYFKILVYYFFPRGMIITLFFMVSNLLNKRTYKLLDDEIRVHDEQEKAKTELEVAKGIQRNTLPKEFASKDGIEIISELRAAKEVGGDFYDYVDIDKDHVAIIIGDVSGKGVPAAMFMMKTITSFRDFARAGKSPSEILKDVNASIFKGNTDSMFVTCFLAILDKKTGKLEYSNAGHNPPVVGKAKNYKFLRNEPGLILGCFEKCNVKDYETTLKPGESITLYTDGITEARNGVGEFFGEERLINIFNKREYSCPLEFHHQIKDEIAEFVKDAPQSDDITILTLRYKGDHLVYDEKFFKGNKEELANMLSFIRDFCTRHNFPEEFKNQLMVVGDEILSNIINHGYENNGGTVFMRLFYNEDKQEFVFTIIDRAPEFNQLSVEDSPIQGDAKKQKIGGLGILIVKNIMSDSSYQRINNKNVLIFKKRFNWKNPD